jgi:hypothetical protein
MDDFGRQLGCLLWILFCFGVLCGGVLTVCALVLAGVL